MGKASKWFRALLRLNQPASNPTRIPTASKLPKDSSKRRWRFIKSYKEKSSSSNSNTRGDVFTTHARGEDCVASIPTCASGGGREVEVEVQVSAAIVIQSCFRGYLARTALRALKGLVKLQALARGHIMRRKTAETMRCMQALLQAQARARSLWAYFPHNESSPLSTTKSSQLHLPKNNSKSSSQTSIITQDRLNFGSSSSNPPTDDPTHKTSVDQVDKILEMDTARPYLNTTRRNFFKSSHAQKDSNPFQFSENIDDLLTPTKSESSTSLLSGHSECPNYMAYTESSRAKARSVSAPKSRPHNELKHKYKHRSSFTSKVANPGSGRLNRVGMPVRDSTVIYYSGYLN